MKALVQVISCFLCCLLTMLTFCSCQIEAASEKNTETGQNLLGDADGDGEISIIDATVIQRHLAQIPVTEFHEDAADVDGSGDVEITDATYIQRHLVDLEVPYKIGEPIKNDQEDQGDETITMEQTGMTQEEAAQRLGKSRPSLANLLRLLTLHPMVRQMLTEGKLSAGHGRALAGVDEKRQVQLANLVMGGFAQNRGKR